jgi:3,4-dihydroxy 2-butanone 4-phosphate synthase/GTP cyclohydrolase II
MPEGFSTIEAAVAAIRRGEVIVVVDAEDRENEGDFVCAAEKATPEVVNFMIRHGRGQVCMPILPEMARRLDLPMMVQANSTPLGTAYTVPVDHVSARTGITAGERATTIAAILAPESRPADFVRPGHLFPLVAKEGGVLRRAGHTEAAVDLARMAGIQPAGVLCEILDDTGNRADRETLHKMAREHRLEIISIEQLIRHRRTREQLVERIAEADLPTKWGQFRVIAYGVKFEPQQPIVLVMGDPAAATDPLVRLHRAGGEDPGLCPAGPGARHGGGEPGARLQGRCAGLRHRHPDPQGSRPAAGAVAHEQSEEDRRLHLWRLRSRGRRPGADPPAGP